MISRLHLNSFYCPVMSSKEKESELLGHSLWSAIRCQRKATFNPKRIYRRAQDVHRRAIIVSVSSFPRRKFIVSFLELAVKSSTGGYKSLPLFPFPETRSPFPVRLCAAVSTSTLSVSLSLSLSLSLSVWLCRRVSPHLFSPFCGISRKPKPAERAVKGRSIRPRNLALFDMRNARAYTRAA